jgi:hypothetical protein
MPTSVRRPRPAWLSQYHTSVGRPPGDEPPDTSARGVQDWG